tara:strand:+ start:209 stop:964 length:756 start_codon:yes stop_codon:yes gene_type:complete
MNVLSLFDGMSCGQIALNRLGIKYDNYFASEVCKYAIKITQKNYPKTTQLGDVNNINFADLPKIDLIFAGSPCQDLSQANNDGKGLYGSKSKLFFKFIEAKNYLKPNYFLLENVRNKYIEEMNEYVGVNGIKINSDLFVQQNRVRYYWTNLIIGKLPERPQWNGNYYHWRRSYFRKNKSGVSPCLTAAIGGHTVPLKSENVKDKLTPNECEVLQSVPINYTEGVSNTRRYSMLGNGWTVDVICHILKGLSN